MAKGGTLNTLKNYKPRNLLINGGMDHWQRGTSITGISSTTYVNDRWQFEPSGITPNIDIAQSTDVPSQSFINSAKITNQSVVGTIPTSAHLAYLQRVYYKDALKYIGKRVSFSTWVKTNKSGQYSFFMYMGQSVTYQLVKNITLTSGVWTKVEFKSETALPSDFTYSGLVGAFIGVHLVSGTDHHYVEPSDWTRYPDVGINRGATGQVNFCDTIGNEFYMTGAMVTDSEDENAPFQYRGDGVLEELDICQAYFQRMKWATSGFIAPFYAGGTGTVLEGRLQYPRQMISTPTFSASSAADFRLYNSGLHGTTQFTMAGIFPSLGSSHSTYLYLSGTSGLVSGAWYFLQAFNGTNAYFDLNAEL